MAFTLCPITDGANLPSIARDICPFPDYTPNPLFPNMLSINSSLHLRDHYAAVQSSLTPKQLEDFTQSLRTTFGREGRVTLGGVGVVALSLAVLFDSLAREVKGQWVSDSEPIPGLFLRNPRGYYPPHVYTVSRYLRLVPHIANNPARMREETKRCHKQLMIDDQFLDNLERNHSSAHHIKEDITAFNLLLPHIFAASLQIHHLRIKDEMDTELFTPNRRPPKDIIFTFNCDPQTAEKDFLTEVQQSDNDTKEAFKNNLSRGAGTLLTKVAKIEFFNAIIHLSCPFGHVDSIKLQREDFDLKGNALTKWKE